jgi:hypothetical protein
MRFITEQSAILQSFEGIMFKQEVCMRMRELWKLPDIETTSAIMHICLCVKYIQRGVTD